MVNEEDEVRKAKEALLSLKVVVFEAGRLTMGGSLGIAAKRGRDARRNWWPPQSQVNQSITRTILASDDERSCMWPIFQMMLSEFRRLR